MAQDGDMVSSASDRDARLQSAKKKLKSYRAKQAQMEKAKRQSTMMSASSSSGGNNGILTNGQLASPSISPTRLVGAVINEAFRESQDAMMRRGSADRSSQHSSNQSEWRHSRGLSRSGSSGAHTRGHSRTGSISLSQTALTNGVVAAAVGHLAQKKSINIPSTSRPVSIVQHIANTSHSHTRGHSRSGSKSLAASASAPSRSRPQSLVGGVLTESRRQPQQYSTEDDSWADEQVNPHQTTKTPHMDGRFIDPSQFETPIVEQNPPSAPAVSLTMATPDTSTLSHSRRPSRHARKGSVSTRRESMEIMGGLANHDINSTSNRHSRRISNSHRWSGLPSASILFGGESDYIPHSRKRETSMDTDLSNEDEEGNRQSALEKLEGRGLNRTSLQSIVQLPSFDDVHGDEGMDKRASLTLLEANVHSTSSEKMPTTFVPASPRPLNMMEGVANKDLGVLVEEEEEEDESGLLSPIREKDGINFISEDEMRKQKMVEREVIKRNRRGSLTPQPLKLKSRPASLFVAPRSSALSTSLSLPSLMNAMLEDTEEPGVQTANVPVSTNKTLAMSPLPNTARSTPNMSSPRPSQASSRHESPRKHPIDSIASVNRGITSARAPMYSPSKDTKKGWRSSMPNGAMTPLQTAATTSPSSVTSSGGSRQGMRVLRLGSSNLSTSSNASSTILREHNNRTDSTSSLSSTTSGASMPISTRGSLVYNQSPAASGSNPFKEDASPLERKRGSLIYKSSPLDSSTLSHVSSSSMSAPSASLGGVPFNLFEELKSKHQREVGLLDEARHKIARLEGEAQAEAKRKGNELAEVERWSIEEKKALGLRIEHLEANIVQIVQLREAKERSLIEEKSKVEEKLLKAKSDFEDVEAERDMLREDVEGWRTRCSGLEKGLRAEKSHIEELRQSKSAAKNRIRELLEKLQENGITVDRSSVDEEELSVELKSILRSPDLNSNSPLLGAKISRGDASSPIMGDITSQIPPSQAVQLLKEMRQQIFNLAGTLEHERKQHVLTRQEADAAKEQLSKIALYSSISQGNIGSISDLSGSPEKSEIFGSSSSSNTTPAPAMSTPPYSEKMTQRKHVFAYDSSMDSRSGSNSLGSGSAMTHQTSQHEDDEYKSKDDNLSLINSTQSAADLVGLGMGGSLDPLLEEEENEQERDKLTSLLATNTANTVEKSSVDFESGGRVSDSDSITPPTPSLEHALDPQQMMKQEKSQVYHSSFSSSTGSREPPSPILGDSIITGPASVSSQGTIHPPFQRHFELEDEEEVISPLMKSRPEFIREWSFEKATAKINKSQSTKSRPLRTSVITNGLNAPPKRKKNHKVSIDDFFGIMNLGEDESLPALPTPDEALEMPPLFIETDYRLTNGRQYSNSSLPRYPSTIRPPVPRSSAMYNRSVSDRSSSSISRTSSSFNRFQYPEVNSTSTPMKRSSSAESETSVYSVGGGMLSRVVSITSAFGGYLLGSNNDNEQQQQQGQNHHQQRGGVPHNENIGWAITRQQEEIA